MAERVKRSGARAILWGGSIAGVLDILAAFVSSGMHGRGPDVVLHGIAFGLLGVKAFRGGVPTALLGLACHFAIAFGAAATYYAASRVLRVLVTQPVVCGLLYGIPVYFFTNYVVIPLSKIGLRPMGALSGVLISLAVLMVCVGLPIALATRRYGS
jgi:hypothetical protein